MKLNDVHDVHKMTHEMSVSMSLELRVRFQIAPHVHNVLVLDVLAVHDVRDVQHDDVEVGGLGHGLDVELPCGLGISLLCERYEVCRLEL